MDYNETGRSTKTHMLSFWWRIFKMFFVDFYEKTLVYTLKH